jgi:hypothetical protein
MYIEPWKCANCEHTGYPGEDGLQVVTDSSGTIVHCKCGNTQKLDRAKDLMILSENSFVRLTAASNYAEYGQIALASGESTTVSFQKRFDFPCNLIFAQIERISIRFDIIHANRGRFYSKFEPKRPEQYLSKQIISSSAYGCEASNSIRLSCPDSK